MTDKALKGLKVLEYAHLVSGPFCAKLLADLGAEVIKIEEPGIGDPARREPPFPQDIPHPERSGLFLYLNTNKLGITLDTKTCTGKEIFGRLIQDADILIENNPAKVMVELGLDYSSLKRINPRLIMTSITPFGQSGPYRDYRGYDLNCWQGGFQGYRHTGIYQTLVFEGQLRHEPLKGPGRQADFQAGAYAVVGTMGALHAREIFGVGQHIDVSVQEAAGSFAAELCIWSYVGYPGGGQQIRLIDPWTLLTCKDGYAYLWVQEEEQWERLVELMGNPDWAREEIFKDLVTRAQNFTTLEVLLCDWSREWTVYELYHEAQARRIPIVPVNAMEDLFNSHHLRDREFFTEIDHPVAGKLTYPGTPFKMSKTPWKVERPAPLLGEHNEVVYCKRLGYAGEDLVKMRGAGII